MYSLRQAHIINNSTDRDSICGLRHWLSSEAVASPLYWSSKQDLYVARLASKRRSRLPLAIMNEMNTDRQKTRQGEHRGVGKAYARAQPVYERSE